MSNDEPLDVLEFLDPPPAHPAFPGAAAPAAPSTPWVGRMFAALLDPQTIQWMLMLGGGLMVLGVVIWLVSAGLFQNKLALAVVLTLGSLAIHLSGCFVALKTRYRIAGGALAFVGCILLPLNLWFYHAQGLVTLDGKLWLGGVVCTALYGATVLLLRDPKFLYAVEAGITLTVLLLLGQQGVISDSTWLSLVLVGMGLISIHAERAFAADEKEEFSRTCYGLPIFWSGHVQLAVGLIALLGSQFASLLVSAAWFDDFTWPGNRLTQSPWLAGGLWLAAAYAYLYSDLVVRRLGFYVYLAAGALVAAELTLFGDNLPREVLIAAPAITGLLLGLLAARSSSVKDRLSENLQPLSFMLCGLSVLVGVVCHIQATSRLFDVDPTSTGWSMVLALLVAAGCQRVLAWLQQSRSREWEAAYLALTAGSLLVAVAALLRNLGVLEWSRQAPVLMAGPICYILAARGWRGKSPEQPLGVIAHVGCAVILLHVFAASVNDLANPLLAEGAPLPHLWLGLVFVEATVFYLLAAWLRRHGANIYAATAAACCAVWQLAAHLQVPDAWYTMLYAGLGLALLILARAVGMERTTVYHAAGYSSQQLLGRGVAAFHSACGLLSAAFVAALLQGLARLATNTQVQATDLLSLGLTAVVGGIAAVIAPAGGWRRTFSASAAALVGLLLLTLAVQLELPGWRKLQIVAVILGLVALIGSAVGRFLEQDSRDDDLVTLGLWVGSGLTVLALLIGTLYQRFGLTEGVSLVDHLAVLATTVLLLVCGFSFRLQAPTTFGGLGLGVHLAVMIATAEIFQHVALGVYLAAGGGLLFVAGIALSVYRERLLALPDRFARREGLFQFLNWR